MSEQLKALLEKRAKLVSDARAVLDRHKDAGKLPAEEQAQYDRIMKDAMEATGEIEERNSFAERQKQLAAADAWAQGVEKRNLDPNGRPASNPARAWKPAATAACWRSVRATPSTPTSSRTTCIGGSAITSSAKRCPASCRSSIATCWPTRPAAVTTSSRRSSSSTRSSSPAIAACGSASWPPSGVCSSPPTATSRRSRPTRTTPTGPRKSPPSTRTAPDRTPTAVSPPASAS